MLGLQQTVIKLIDVNDRPVIVGVDDINISTAYAAMRNNDPGPRPSTSSGAESPCSQNFPLNGGCREYRPRDFRSFSYVIVSRTFAHTIVNVT